MNQFTLTLLDTTGIQDYIFASNRLQENIGASEIVYRATTLWVFEELGKAGFAHNVILKENKFEWEYVPDFRIEDKRDDNAVEIIYGAGGNAVLIFKTKEKAIQFTKAITTRVLRDAPGITMLAQHLEFNWQNDRLSDEVEKIKIEGKEVEKVEKGKRSILNDMMTEHKRKRTTSSASLGYSVTATCDSTGLPAIGTNEAYKALSSEPTFFVSSETLAKLANRDYAKDRLELLIGDTKGTKFPYDIDLLGRVTGEESYVAVVHVDGNRVGHHVQSAMSNVKDNREYIKASRTFSQSIQQASLNTIKRIVNSLLNTITVEANGDKYIKTVPLAKKNNVHYLPFRPLVFGGDDVTFLCNGQLGVELAAKYLFIFEEETQKANLENFHASAGISIVKMHYPFARAYSLAEELTASAKTLNRGPKPDFSALDWHFAQSGLSGSLKAIREREYCVPEIVVEDLLTEETKDIKQEDKVITLTMRPLQLTSGKSGRYWEGEGGTRALIEALKTKKPWSESHNKVIQLREELRKGTRAVQRYLVDFDLGTLPKTIPGSENTGWYKLIINTDDDKKESVKKLECRCVYFDAIELLDHYVALDQEA